MMKILYVYMWQNYVFIYRNIEKKPDIDTESYFWYKRAQIPVIFSPKSLIETIKKKKTEDKYFMVRWQLPGAQNK